MGILALSDSPMKTADQYDRILQRATPWFDGVPAVQQCPIAPGKSFTYQFKADLYGSSWYHSHYSAQYAGGALGREFLAIPISPMNCLLIQQTAMIIHGPKNVAYDKDLGPVFLTDWYHDEYFSIVQKVMSSPVSRKVSTVKDFTKFP